MKRAHEMMPIKKIDFDKVKKIKKNNSQAINFIEEVIKARVAEGRKNAFIETELIDKRIESDNGGSDIIWYFEELGYVLRVYMITSEQQIFEVCWG